MSRLKCRTGKCRTGKCGTEKCRTGKCGTGESRTGECRTRDTRKTQTFCYSLLSISVPTRSSGALRCSVEQSKATSSENETDDTCVLCLPVSRFSPVRTPPFLCIFRRHCYTAMYSGYQLCHTDGVAFCSERL